MKRSLIAVILCIVALLTISGASAATWGSAPAAKTWTHDRDNTFDLAPDLTLYASGDIVGLTDSTNHFTGSGVCGPTQCMITVTPYEGWAGSEQVTFWIDDGVKVDAPAVTTLTVSNINPTVTGTLPSPVTTNEDSSISVDLVASDVDGDELTYIIVNSPIHGSLSVIDQIHGKVAYTPSADYYGTDSFSFKVNDKVADSTIKTVSVTINPVNDAPQLAAISDSNIQEGISMTVIALPSAQDVDYDVVTYTLSVINPSEDSTFDLSYFDSATRVISGWIPTKEDVGELMLKLTATDSNGASDSEEFSINIYPRYMCESGVIGNIVDVTIESPENGDDFGPGETIKIDVTVGNNAADDRDFVVEAVLYDVESNKKIDDVSSDNEEIESGEDLEFNLELPLSLDGDEDWDGKYVLYVKAYEDGKEDEQCIMDSVEVDIKRDNDRVIVKDITMTPYMVDAGEKVEILVDVLSIGEDDQKEVYVTIEQSALGIDLKSDKIALEEYDGSNVAHAFRFTGVPVSSSADGGDYQLYVTVHYDGKSNKYVDSPTFVSTAARSILTVKEAVVSTYIEAAEPELATDNTYSVPVTITNTGDAGEFTLSLEGVTDFAKPVASKTISLESSEEVTEYFTLEIKDDAEAKTYAVDAILRTASGNIASRTSFEVDLKSAGEGWLSSKTFWIIGDIVLIVVALFFLKLIFGGRRPDIQEVKL